MRLLACSRGEMLISSVCYVIPPELEITKGVVPIGFYQSRMNSLLRNRRALTAANRIELELRVRAFCLNGKASDYFA